MNAPQPSGRKLAGIALILLLIAVWAAFVASLAPFVGRWPVLVQAPFYLVHGNSLDHPVETLDPMDSDRLVPRPAATVS